MVIKIGSTTYTDLKSLAFAPETDVAGVQVSINEFSAELITTDTIPNGAVAELRDDLNQLWASYWIVDAKRLDAATVQITARSKIHLLDRRTMPAVMYNITTLGAILQDVFQDLGSSAYTVDSTLAATSIAGYCPEQSARERLLWAVFVSGGYVKTYNSDKIEILPIDDTDTLVPFNKTFWRPSLTYGEWVTSLRVRAYTFTSGTPQVTDNWVQAGGSTWIVTYQDFTLANPGAPSTADENEVAVADCMLVNINNVSGILTHLSKYYFDRVTVEADLINNREYEPGQKLTVYTREDQLVTGYATSAAFSFGVQARSRIKLVAAEVRTAAALTFLYKYGDRVLDSRTVCLPVGYSYAIQNPYFDQIWQGRRVVYRPTAATATGTVPSGGGTVTVTYAEALVQENGILEIISVDSVSITDGEVSL